jgi:hypothetical protein
MRWYGPNRAHGLLRLMDIPYFSEVSSTGFGWWLFLDGISLQFHQMTYSLGTLVPTESEPDDLAPLRCASHGHTITADKLNGTLVHYESMSQKDFQVDFVVAPPTLSGKSSEFVYIRWHILRLRPAESIRVCRRYCETFVAGQVDLKQFTANFSRLEPPFRLTVLQKGIQVPTHDPSQCADLLSWVGSEYFPKTARSCSSITAELANEHCVNENTDKDGTSVVEACCICGGGSKKNTRTTIEVKLPNKYADRRYKLLASYYVTSNATHADRFFAEQEKELRREAQHFDAADNRVLNRTHRLKISNGANGLLGSPVCFENEMITDSGSPITIQKGTRGDESVIDGAWQGTCSPKVPRTSLRCNVHFIARMGWFEWRIDGCFGSLANRLATGRFQVQQEGKSNIDSFGSVIGFMKRMDLFYSTGILTSPTLQIRGAVVWKSDLPASRDEITLVINPPGDLVYPGDYADATLQTAPCQVAELRRIPETEYELPLPRSSIGEAALAINLLNLYQKCNQSIANLENLYTGDNLTCSGVLEGLIGTRLSVGGLSPQTFLEIEKACSNDRCFPIFNSTLYQTIEICRSARVAFLGIFPAEESRYADLDSFFKARLIFLAETLTRVESTCTSNYFKKSCRSVMHMIQYPAAGTCAVENTPTASISMAGASTFAFDMTQSAQTGQQSAQTVPMMCSAGCTQMLRTIVKETHCCAASFYEEQSLYLDIVGPGQKIIQLDIRAYRCLYQKDFQCANSSSEMLILNQPYFPSPTFVKYPVRVALNEKCAMSRFQSVKCAVELCAPNQLGLKFPQLPWPKPCCRGHKCLNGGILAFSGRCFCTCPPPYVSADCGKNASHVSAALILPSAQFIALNEDDFNSILAQALQVEPSAVETAFVNILPGARRDGSGLEVGFRVILDSKRALMRVVEVLSLADRIEQLSKMMQSEGLGAVSGFSRKPKIIDNEKFLKMTDIAGNLSVQGAAGAKASGTSSVSIWNIALILIGVFVPMIAAVGCCFACR